MKRVEIVSVGTEILLGEIVDTNAAELGRAFAAAGLAHHFRQTVGDNLERLTAVLRQALERADVVVTIGGLGPTEDDLTREGIAAALGVALEKDAEIEAHLRALFARRKRVWVESQVRQAMRPAGSEVVANPNGSAPGLIVRAEGKTLIAMPGPRNEFVPMLEGRVGEVLREIGGGGTIRTRTLKVVGIGESVIEEELRDLMAGSQPSVAPYAKTWEVFVRLAAQGKTAEEADAMMAPVAEEIYRRLGDAVYGEDGTTLEAVVVRQLREAGWTLGTAESCTGGGIGERVTRVAGASAVYLGGVVSYDNAVKTGCLGVREETLAEFGAVSAACAEEMAASVRARMGVDVGVSVTGIAGPDGGSAEKPVGLVYVGVAWPGGVEAFEHRFIGTREAIRERAIVSALTLVRRVLLGRSLA